MKMDNLSILTSLFAIINENDKEDSFSILANYFLENYKDIPQMNIYEIADNCYLSRASVRRFCQYIGFNNFKDFKVETKKFNEHYESYVTSYDSENFKSMLKTQIIDTLTEIDNNFNDSDALEIVDQIYLANRVVIFASDTMNSRIKLFQKSMLLYGKIIRLVSDTFMDNVLLENMSTNDLIIVLSPSGRFAKSASNVIDCSKSNTICITASNSEYLVSKFNHVYSISNVGFKYRHIIYDKYGMDYVVDLVLQQYCVKYRSELKYQINEGE